MEVTKETVLKAWKDEQFRSELPEDVREQIPASPTGEDGSQLTDEQLEAASGAWTPVAAVMIAGFTAGATLEGQADSPDCK